MPILRFDMSALRFRQIHLDFHTSPNIDKIGEEFDKLEFQNTLKDACVDSITCFATCHHGWAYYDTSFGNKHKNLKSNLLKQQIDACKEIDVNVPIYITAGVNDWAASEHPEWRCIDIDGKYLGWTQSMDKPGFKTMCFNSPYLDLLCDQIKEVATLFPEGDGIFLDIISQDPCACKWCRSTMKGLGLDFTKLDDRKKHAKLVLEKYYQKTTEALRSISDTMPIFHNSGHVQSGDTEVLKYFSHLELESLPTGGWGYDHFPMSAKYVNNLDFDVMGMTGKFHTTWGEFGGFKHPNALRYECAAMLAFGSKCSVGDQLHPSGKLDKSTYNIIGQAYAEVKAKEPWCDKVTQLADVSLLSNSSIDPSKAGLHSNNHAEEGASRMLLEGHIPFSIIDTDMDFTQTKLLILADDIKVNETLRSKIQSYLDQGGKLLLSGESGIDDQGNPLFDIGGNLSGQSPYRPDYILAKAEYAPEYLSSPLVMYTPSQRFKTTTGKSLGEVYDPYFNRTHEHYSSHQHTPFQPEPSEYSMGAIHGNIAYFAHQIFSQYRGLGTVVYKDIFLKVIRDLLADDLSFKSNLPSTARVSIMGQKEENRSILHLLFANTIARGGGLDLSGGNSSIQGGSIEVIEDLLPLVNTTIDIKLPHKVSSVRLEPQGKEISFEKEGDRILFNIESFSCHQMVVLA